LEKYGKLFSNCGKSTFLTLTLRFHALVNSGIKIFGFGSGISISSMKNKITVVFFGFHIRFGKN
jgi:hypothetical protein